MKRIAVFTIILLSIIFLGFIQYSSKNIEINSIEVVQQCCDDVGTQKLDCDSATSVHGDDHWDDYFTVDKFNVEAILAECDKADPPYQQYCSCEGCKEAWELGSYNCRLCYNYSYTGFIDCWDTDSDSESYCGSHVQVPSKPSIDCSWVSNDIEITWSKAAGTYEYVDNWWLDYKVGYGDWDKLYEGSNTSYTETRYDPGEDKTIYFRVKGYNFLGWSSYSDETSTTFYQPTKK